MKMSNDEIVAAARLIILEGKWKAMTERCVLAAADTRFSNTPSFIVRGQLYRAMVEEYKELIGAFDASGVKDLKLISWRTRNLLELAVWSIYCCQSDEKAKSFYDELGRDSLDLLKKLAKWGEKSQQPSEFIAGLHGAGEILKQRAAEKGADDIEKPYTRVASLAAECGFGESYSSLYAILSKTAHPTAFEVLGGRNHEHEMDLANIYFEQGSAFFLSAVMNLETALNKQLDV